MLAIPFLDVLFAVLPEINAFQLWLIISGSRFDDSRRRLGCSLGFVSGKRPNIRTIIAA